MLGAPLLLCTALLGQAFQLAEPHGVLLLRLGAKGPSYERADGPVSEALSAALSKTSKLLAVPAGPGSLDLAAFSACEARERFRCWSDAVIEAGSAGSRYLLVLSASQAQGPVDISVLLMDLDALRSIPRAGMESGSEQLENQIFDRAVRSAEGKADLGEQASCQAFFERVLSRDLHELLARNHDDEPFAQLELERVPAGAALVVDGRELGRATGGGVSIGGLDSAGHLLAVMDPDSGATLLSESVRVAPGTTLRRALSDAPAKSSPARSVLLWSGVATAVLGAVVTGVGVGAQANAEGYVICEAGGCEASTRRPFATLAELSADPTSARDARRGGLLLVPLGYSVMASGLGWSLGSAFLGDEQDFPWWALGAGLLAGLLSYGVSAALGG